MSPLKRESPGGYILGFFIGILWSIDFAHVSAGSNISCSFRVLYF